MNERLFEFLGITQLHRRGVRGSNVSILVHERDKDDVHASMTQSIIRQIAPEATVELWNPSQATFKEDMDAKYPKYDIVNRSFSGERSTDKSKYNTIILSASGNSEDVENLDMRDPSVIGVGSVVLATNGKVYYDICGWNMENVPMEQSLEFMGFSYLETPYGLYSGTSCACPVVTGIVALILSDYKARKQPLNQSYLRKILQSLSINQIYRNNFSIHTDIKGNKSILGREDTAILDNPRRIGHGYVSVVKYQSPIDLTTVKPMEPPVKPPTVSNKVVIPVGATTINVRGKEIKLKVPAQIINNSVLLPLSAMRDIFNVDVLWDSKTKSAVITLKD
jgi:hypothetical protein